VVTLYRIALETRRFHLVFVVDDVALKQDFSLNAIGFTLLVFIPLLLHVNYNFSPRQNIITSSVFMSGVSSLILHLAAYRERTFSSFVLEPSSDIKLSAVVGKNNVQSKPWNSISCFQTSC
jgi:hypothetical protein